MTTLAQFVEQVRTLSDVRNLAPSNPIGFDIEQPTLGQRFRIIGSVPEPLYMGIPINAIWVVLNAASPHFKKVLKLKSITGPSTSGIVGAIVNLTQSWIEVESYEEIFADPQFYVNGSGLPGPTGPAGAPGLNLRGPYASSTVYAVRDFVSSLGSSYASLVNNNIGNLPSSSPSQWMLVAQKGDTGVVDNAAIVAAIVAQLQPHPTSIVLSGLPTITDEGQSYQLLVTATLNNNATQDVTTSVTYTLSDNTAGSVNASGLFTAASVSADRNISITATLTATPTNLTSSRATTVRNRIPVSLAIFGNAEVDEGTSTQYTAIVTYNTGGTQDITGAAVWGVSPSARGTITTVGVFTAAEVTSDTAATITAAYTEAGVTVNTTRAITVIDTETPIFPRFGTGPAMSVPSYNSAFVNGLSGTATNAGITNTFTLNGGSPNSGIYLYYAYPKALGLARFEDAAAPGFFGGWDGAQGDPFDPAKQGPVEFNVTVGGNTQLWYLYRTDFDGLGSITFTASPAP